LTIGRLPDNSVVVADERVSRTHARLEPTASGWVVSDLNSSNGTRLDGTRINPGVPAAIGPGSVIAVGPLELKVISAGAQGGSRALADSDRTRISAEVLGRSSHQR
jgi:pSer/pThr/pTyr-binding forkhead associated (FHA) protein